MPYVEEANKIIVIVIVIVVPNLRALWHHTQGSQILNYHENCSFSRNK